MDVRGGGADHRITRREREVLDALGERLTNAEIADRLFISYRTVESHVSSLLRKLHAADRLELADIANRASVDPLQVPLPLPLVRIASTPYVGASLESARAALGTPGAGRRVLWIRGEPGIGKTRLLAALGQQRHDEGAVVLYGRCAEAVGGPFQPFREAIRQWATSLPARSIAAVSGPHLPHLARLVPELAVSHATGAPAEEAHVLFDAVDALLSAIADKSPVLLLLDDLQWADRSSLLLLGHLARSSRLGPVTIVAAYRDTDLDRAHPLADTLADLRRDTLSERLSLTPLDAAAINRLVADLSPELAERDMDRIARETRGKSVLRHRDRQAPRRWWEPRSTRERARGDRSAPFATDASDQRGAPGRVGRRRRVPRRCRCCCEWTSPR